jgi:hypothetical protein
MAQCSTVHDLCKEAEVYSVFWRFDRLEKTWWIRTRGRLHTERDEKWTRGSVTIHEFGKTSR